MAKYKRQKVKHYHRSFYSREMRVKRGIGIVVLVAAVLAAAWFAAPCAGLGHPHLVYRGQGSGLRGRKRFPRRGSRLLCGGKQRCCFAGSV